MNSSAAIVVRLRLQRIDSPDDGIEVAYRHLQAPK